MINLRNASNSEADLGELTYLLSAGSNRIGGLDFQASHTAYVARDDEASFEQLLELAALVEAGASIPDSLAAAAQHGTSIGGARPKALLSEGDRGWVAKFSATTDTRPVAKAEAVAMVLAYQAGLDVAPVRMLHVAGRDVLLVQRFDRSGLGGTHTRRLMLSMLTILGYSEMGSRHASYAQMAAAIRTGPWRDVPGTLRELYGRLVLNILVGNTDDHLRNHAAFWDGLHLELTPAYDIAPQPRSGHMATQSIGITADGRRVSQLRLCMEVAGDFLLTSNEAKQIITRVRGAVETGWDDACQQAHIGMPEQRALWGREFMNPYIDDDNE